MQIAELIGSGGYLCVMSRWSKPLDISLIYAHACHLKSERRIAGESMRGEGERRGRGWVGGGGYYHASGNFETGTGLLLTAIHGRL
jgi:hypothetical protein